MYLCISSNIRRINIKQMKKILIGISGGIAAYKTLDIISILIKKGYDVHVIMTDNAKHFCPSDVVNVISKGNLKTETPDQTTHIEEAKWCDVFLLVPATANSIAKIANGIADNFLLSTVLALPDKIRVVCPAMNTNMWENPITQRNISTLNDFGWCVISPVSGMLACNDIGMGKLPKPIEIVDKLIDIIDPLPKWNFPLNMKYVGTNNDSYSFLDIDLNSEVEIPTYPHVGSFGIRRRHDIHGGVDLYANIGTPVYPVENGVVVAIDPFTGKDADCDWWEDTWAVYVEGESGTVCYGEILPNPRLKVGDKVEIAKGDIKPNNVIGTVLRVIRNDKGRPTSMLHLELHKHGVVHGTHWVKGKGKSENLLDPTQYLIKSKK